MSQHSYAEIYESLKEFRRRGELQGGLMEHLSSLDPDMHRSLDQLAVTLRRRDDAMILRHLAVRAIAIQVFGGEEKADVWLHRPNKAMAGQIPFDLVSDELGAAVVFETLEQIDRGILLEPRKWTSGAYRTMRTSAASEVCAHPAVGIRAAPRRLSC